MTRPTLRGRRALVDPIARGFVALVVGGLLVTCASPGCASTPSPTCTSTSERAP